MFGSGGLTSEESQRLERIEQKLDRLLRIFDEAGASAPSSPSDSALAAAWDLADQGQLIAAVKEYRDKTGCGLKEAKDAVEAYIASRGKR